MSCLLLVLTWLQTSPYVYIYIIYIYIYTHIQKTLWFHLSVLLPLEVQRTEQQCLLGGNETCKQCVLPPHDVVSSLYAFPENFFPMFTGEPGRLSKYWDENMDLYESLGMPDLDPWFCLDQILWYPTNPKSGFGWMGCLYFILHAYFYKLYLRILRHVCHFDCTGTAPMRNSTSRSTQYCRYWPPAVQP